MRTGVNKYSSTLLRIGTNKENHGFHKTCPKYNLLIMLTQNKPFIDYYYVINAINLLKLPMQVKEIMFQNLKILTLQDIHTV